MLDTVAKSRQKSGQKLNKVDRKVDKKRKKVDRKFRMTPKIKE